MKITFVVAVFPPEPEPAAVMAGELTEAWAQEGHVVTVVCPFPNRPGGTVYPGFQRGLWRKMRGKSVSIVRVWTWLVGRRRLWLNRLLENLSFGVAAFFSILLLPKPDVVVAEVWPVFAQVACALACRFRNIPLINYVQDLYPEALCAAGVVKEGSLLERIVRKVDRWVCASAARNVVVSDGMRQMLISGRGTPPAKVSVIPNWLNLSEIRPLPVDYEWRRGLGIEDEDLLCMYAGSLGIASGVDLLVDAAYLLRQYDDIKFICVGEGVLKEKMLRAVREKRLERFLFLPFQPREKVASIQSSADVMLLTLGPRISSSSVPSKLITYLAVGRPVICAASRDSDVAKVVEEARVGVVVPPGDPHALAEAVLRIKRIARGERIAMGKRARQLALRRYSLEASLKHFAHILQEVTGKPMQHLMNSSPMLREQA